MGMDISSKGKMMTDVVEEYRNAKKRVQELNAERDRAQGAIDQQMKTLQADFGVSSIEDAEKLLKDLERQESEVKEEFETSFDSWKDKYGDKL